MLAATLLHATCSMRLATILHNVAFVWPTLLNMLQHDPTKRWTQHVASVWSGLYAVLGTVDYFVRALIQGKSNLSALRNLDLFKSGIYNLVLMPVPFLFDV